MKPKYKIILALADATGLEPEGLLLETPENEAFGDYSTNVALILAKEEKKNPNQLANELAEKLNKVSELKEIVEKVEVAGPGFINFWLTRTVLVNELREVFEKKDEYGRADLMKNKKVMVEFAHPNTHKELHVGHMRTLILGEALSRIFEFVGAQVFRANYQGDIGPHVAKAIWGTEKLLEQRNTSWDEAENLTLFEKAHLLGEGYVLGNKEYEISKEEIDALNTKLYQRDPKALPIYEMTRKWSLEYFESFYKRFGTKFDKLYFESEIAGKGKEVVLSNLDKVFEKSEGAIIFDGEKYGLHKRVFLTKDGNPTYEAKDMGLAPTQFDDFAFDLNIHVVANEQKGYFQVIIKALELIDEKFKGREYHLPMGMVNLIGRKMSSRTGEIYTVDQLLEDVKKEVAPLIKDENLPDEEKAIISEIITVAAVKYSMLRVNPTADVAFDLKQSVSLDGNSGPYLQYTFVRTRSVARKSGDKNQEFRIQEFNINGEELSVLRGLIHFSEVIENAAESYSPNLLTNYLFNIAQKYNTFYDKHKILGGDNEEFRLALTSSCGQILKNGLKLLGIETPDKM